MARWLRYKANLDGTWWVGHCEGSLGKPSVQPCTGVNSHIWLPSYLPLAIALLFPYLVGRQVLTQVCAGDRRLGFGSVSGAQPVRDCRACGCFT